MIKLKHFFFFFVHSIQSKLTARMATQCKLTPVVYLAETKPQCHSRARLRRNEVQTQVKHPAAMRPSPQVCCYTFGDSFGGLALSPLGRRDCSQQIQVSIIKRCPIHHPFLFALHSDTIILHRTVKTRLSAMHCAVHCVMSYLSRVHALGLAL